MHKNTRLLPYQRREAYRLYLKGETVASLSRKYGVSRKTLYAVFKKARLGVFGNYSSKNNRYRKISYGLKRLLKSEDRLAKYLAGQERRNKRYEKTIPGEMVHFDTKRLPLIYGEAAIEPREYLFVAIDDYSRWLYADIFPDKTAYSSAIFISEVKRAMPFSIRLAYSDNGSEYKGRRGHPFVDACRRAKISQAFTRVKHPWTNGKAERVIRTLMEEWHQKRSFYSREERRRFLAAYIRWYNEVRPHLSLGGISPLDRLEKFFSEFKSVTNPRG